MSWYAVLTYDDADTKLYIGDGSSSLGFNATSGGIEGWYSTPEAKWGLTEKTTGHGAFELGSDDEVLYSARTVTLHLWAEGETRREVVANKVALRGCAGQTVRLLVSDGGYYCYVEGYATVEDAGGTLSDRRDEMTITIECPDPYIYVYRYLLAEYTASGTDGGDFEFSPYVHLTGTGSGVTRWQYYISSVGFDVEYWPILHVTSRSGKEITYLYLYVEGSDTMLPVSAEDISLYEVYIDLVDGVAYDGDGNDVSDLFENVEELSAESDVVSEVTIKCNKVLVDIELQFWHASRGSEKWL